MTREERFWEALRDVFVGTPVEGESGYINLMLIKSHYYQQSIFPVLQREIDEALKPFPQFREELFDKLYSFFHRYFSESGSIYFRYTPLHQNIYKRVYNEEGEAKLRPLITYDQDYEHVYTNEQDVILFWKTQMLYYVKTERLFESMDVEVEDFRFHFDVSRLQHKMANEKRELVFEFAERRGDDTLVFTVTYSTYGRKTKLYDIRKELRQTEGKVPNQDILERAFAVFERQSEVDYFINKNTRAFLKEQFDLWMYQYIFSRETSEKSTWTSVRVQQLQSLKDIAYRLIDFIAQFEDELVKIWNKPKFVRNGHYVITLDRIAYPEEESANELHHCPPERRALLERIVAHPSMTEQVAEWQALGMVDDDFELSDVWHEDLFGEQLDEVYQFLPLDTKYIPDLELEILGLFEHLDNALDGWLIKSDNYQALNSLQKKFGGKVNFIYIDPPYNADATEILYENTYKHSSWLSLMQDRLALAKDYLIPNLGILCVTIDDNEAHNLKILLQGLFDEYDTITVVIEHNYRGRSQSNFSLTHEYALWVVKRGFDLVTRLEEVSDDIRRNLRRTGVGSFRTDSPSMFYGIEVDKESLEIVRVTEALEENEPIPEHTDPTTEMIWPIDSDGLERRWYYGRDTVLEEVGEGTVWAKRISGEIQIHYYQPGKRKRRKTVWTGSKLDASTFGSELLNSMFLMREFPFPKSIHAVERSIEAASEDEDALIMDFFAGSGTTAHAVMNLNRRKGNRKYILVEMGDHFEKVIVPRIKKAAFCEDWESGKAAGGPGISHFVKYYYLEQYEETLRRVHYKDAPLFQTPYKSPYNQYIFLRDLKFMQATDVSHKEDSIQVDLTRLYDDIDLAETLSCITGKSIRHITSEHVEFEDGSRADLQEPDWQLVEPLIWW